MEEPRTPTWKIVTGVGLVAAAAIALGVLGTRNTGQSGSGDGTDQPIEQNGGMSVNRAGATLVRIARAATDGQSGVSIRPAGGEESGNVQPGVTLEPGTMVRTDARTRAQIELGDGSILTLNHSTELQIGEGGARQYRIRTGEIVADIQRLPNAPTAVFDIPTGRVEVLGTKFVLSATDEGASVRVARGEVRLASSDGKTLDIKAGQEGLLAKGAEPSVSQATNLAASVDWSQLDTLVEKDAPVAGIGELRAKKPGEREQQERPLSLAYHSVTVRIVGNIARTEIEESFRNDGSSTLEGMYRFPLPTDARLAALSLEVDGRWEEGAFVARDRAQKIWRGVIRNATPVAFRQPNEEYIWVPGPWRDPALLEWQRGGRFELRIFPIPAHGERRIRIAYTQTIAPYGRGRRYIYPLAHSSDGSTRVGRFNLAVRVAGVTRDNVTARTYPMSTASESNAQVLSYAQDNFMPAGDVVVDYELPGDEAEVRWWTFAGAATAVPPNQTREEDTEVLQAHRALHADTRPYVAFALKPRLPNWIEAKPRDYVLVVDSSQSMVGERFDRASELVAGIVSEMDRRDRFWVMACDLECNTFGDTLEAPSAEAAAKVREWLRAVRPAGSSNVAMSLRFAANALSNARRDDRDGRVLYVGDGMSTVGYRHASAIAGEVSSLASDPRVTFTTVGVGSDADAVTLQAVARAGGGHYVPYMPGQRASTAALAVLETTYGVSLENAQLTLPEGITDIAPASLPTLRAGEEIIVVGRMSGNTIQGDVALRGKIAGREWTNRYPASLTASTAAGNTFVPRLWASTMIDELELEAKPEERPRIVALSKSYAVMSRSTSLLVLESEAMFRAFGVDRASPALTWTGEEDAESGEAQGTEAYADGTMLDAVSSGVMASNRSGAGAGPGLGTLGGAGGDRARQAPASPTPAPMASRASAGPMRRAESAPAEELAADRDDEMERSRSFEPEGRAAAAPTTTSVAEIARPMPPPTDTGRWMKRVWYREGQVSYDRGPTANDQATLVRADQAFAENPNSRDRNRALVRALLRTGDLARAAQSIDTWMKRDPLDAEALTYSSDVLGRNGDRDEALRVLSGIVDLESDNVVLHERLAKTFERLGAFDKACAHRFALAEIKSNDMEARNAAAQCGQNAKANESQARASGELLVEGSWRGAGDLDVSLITPQGSRVSALGGRVDVVSNDATEAGREALGLRRASVGTYLVEISRTKQDDRMPADGTLRIRVLGTEQRIPFRLTNDRTVVGRVTVARRSRLE